MQQNDLNRSRVGELISNTMDERSPIKPKLDNDSSDQKKKNRRGRANRSG